MIYLFAARARLAVFRFADVARLAVLRFDGFFFSAPPRLCGEAVPSPTNAALTHTTGGSPSIIARQDLPSSLEP